MEIYLFRHGETDWNRDRRLQGQSDIPLNEFGRELAAETAGAVRDISFDRAFCSPLRRAAETAEIILGARDIPLVRDRRLMEINFGEYEGNAFDAMKKDPAHVLHNFFCKPECYMPYAGMESFQDVMDRGRSFFQEEVLPLEGSCERLLIVAHGAFNRCVLSMLRGIPLRDFWQTGLPNCAVSILTLEGGKYRVVEESRIYYENPVNVRP